MTNTAAQSAPDNRLICSCGELGTVTPCEPEPGFGDENGGFRVFCQRDGKPCCMSHLETTPELAIAAFVRLQAIPESFAEDRDPAGWEGGFADNPMDPEEILRRSEAFDPTPNREAIMRLALDMIVAQAQGGQRLHLNGTGLTAYPLIIRTAERALRECA